MSAPGQPGEALLAALESEIHVVPCLVHVLVPLEELGKGSSESAIKIPPADGTLHETVRVFDRKMLLVGYIYGSFCAALFARKGHASQVPEWDTNFRFLGHGSSLL
jgi:hypothetical protein